MQTIRDSRLDVIRVVACLAVVLLHVSARPIYMQGQVSDVWWFLGNAISSLTHWCVPVFVMLSGALLLGNPKTTYSDVLRRRVPRFIGILVVATIIYGLWLKYHHHSFDWLSFRTSILSGQPYYHLYFFYVIIGLYLIAPMISKGLLSFQEQDVRHATIALSVITCVSFTWSVFSSTYTPNGSTFAWPYVSYFLMGYYLYRYSPQLPYGWITLVSYIATVAGTQFLAVYMGPTYPWKLYFYTYFSPTVYFFALGIFGMGLRASREKLRPIILFLSPLTLIVYIVHPMIMEKLRSIAAAGFPELVRLKYDLPFTYAMTVILAFALAYALRLIPFVRRYC